MKKILSAVLLLLVLLTGCKKEEKVTLIAPNGTPLVAIGDLLDSKKVSIENVNGADALTAALTAKSHDIVIAPVTAGTKLYLKGASKYRLDSVLTTNNTYVVSRKQDALASIDDLEGKSILAYGQNNTPDIILKAALAKADVTTTVTYDTDVASVVARFITDTTDPTNTNSNTPEYILIAEPSLTQLTVKYGMEINVLNLSEVLSSDISIIPQAGIFINSEAKNQKAINNVIDLIKDNVTHLNDNPEAYAKKIVNKSRVFEQMTVEVIENSIPNSNINFVKAKDMKDSLAAYYGLLNTYNAAILGGKAPSEEFYN